MKRILNQIWQKITQFCKCLDKELLDHKTRKWWVIGVGLLFAFCYIIFGNNIFYIPYLSHFLFKTLIWCNPDYKEPWCNIIPFRYSGTLVVSLLLLQRQLKLVYLKLIIRIIILSISWFLYQYLTIGIESREMMAGSITIAVIIPYLWYFGQKFIFKKQTLFYVFLAFKVLFYPSFEDKRKEYAQLLWQKIKAFWTQYKKNLNLTNILLSIIVILLIKEILFKQIISPESNNGIEYKLEKINDNITYMRKWGVGSDREPNYAYDRNF